MSGSTKADEEPCTLIDAAFRLATRSNDGKSILIEEVRMGSLDDGQPPTIHNIFIPRSNESANEPAVWKSVEGQSPARQKPVPRGPSLKPTVTAVTESPDGTGLLFVWEAETAEAIPPVYAKWSDLPALPLPDNPDPYNAVFVRQQARGLWDLVLDRFEHQIRSGKVQLLGRKGTPFAEPTAVPKAAAPHVQVVDWFNGTVEVAGESVFDVRVIPDVDPETSYVEAVRNAAPPRRQVELIIKKLFPTGLAGRPKPPEKPEPPDHVVLRKVFDEYKRLKIEPASDPTILRAAGRKK
jgi:hypothetical protein